MIHRLLIAAPVAAAVLLAACAHGPPQARWIPYDQVHAKVRRHIDMQPGQLVLACQNMVFVGERRREGDSDELRIVLADGPATYYDNLRGETLQDCNFWYCSRNNADCNAHCPFREGRCSRAD